MGIGPGWASVARRFATFVMGGADAYQLKSVADPLISVPFAHDEHVRVSDSSGFAGPIQDAGLVAYTLEPLTLGSLWWFKHQADPTGHNYRVITCEPVSEMGQQWDYRVELSQHKGASDTEPV